MNKAFVGLLFASVISSVLSACVVVGPGEKPDAVPPRIVLDSNNNGAWDRPGAFGPVPAQLQATGDAICKQFGAKATGYHPNALDAKGVPFPNGGYYCVKSN